MLAPEKCEARAMKFRIGQLVHHKLFHYRGVIYDADPTFAHTEEWYRTVAKSGPPKEEPWYRVLVHGARHETYVAEQNLEPDAAHEPIQHPRLDALFDSFEGDHYARTRNLN